MNSSVKSKGGSNSAKKGKGARRKGHQFERDCAAFFVRCGFPDARRQLEYHENDANGKDLQGIDPFAVQCKCLEGSISPFAVLAEIKGKGFKVAMVKRSNKGWYAALDPEAFAYLLEAHQRLMSLMQRQEAEEQPPSLPND